VLLDLTLPGLSGDEVCRAVRQDPEIADTFLIIVTARERARSPSPSARSRRQRVRLQTLRPGPARRTRREGFRSSRRSIFRQPSLLRRTSPRFAGHQHRRSLRPPDNCCFVLDHDFTTGFFPPRTYRIRNDSQLPPGSLANACITADEGKSRHRFPPHHGAGADAPGGYGEFSSLLADILLAGKIIQREVSKAGCSTRSAKPAR